MLLLLVSLAVILGVGGALAALIIKTRGAHRRRLAKARRQGEYAERQSQWADYTGINTSTPPPNPGDVED